MTNVEIIFDGDREHRELAVLARIILAASPRRAEAGGVPSVSSDNHGALVDR